MLMRDSNLVIMRYLSRSYEIFSRYNEIYYLCLKDLF